MLLFLLSCVTLHSVIDFASFVRGFTCAYDLNALATSCFNKSLTDLALLSYIFFAPLEIAGMVKYLISDDAKGVTGQSINLCAGLSVGY